jgi:hypothetical protein
MPAMDITEFLNEIEAFLKRTGMRPSMLGHRAVNDGKFVTRLRNGGQVTLRTMARVRMFMDRCEYWIKVAEGNRDRTRGKRSTRRAA